MELKDIRIGMKVRVLPSKREAIENTILTKYEIARMKELEVVVTRIRDVIVCPINCSYLENADTRIFSNHKGAVDFVFEPDELMPAYNKDESMLNSLTE